MCGEERRRETALAALPGWHEEEREEDDDGEEERGIDVPRVGTADKWYGNIRVSQTFFSRCESVDLSLILKVRCEIFTWQCSGAHTDRSAERFLKPFTPQALTTIASYDCHERRWMFNGPVLCA